MRITSIQATQIPPVKTFKVNNLSDVVIIAGANGVGKTRLINSLIAHLRGIAAGVAHFQIEATCDSEKLHWGKNNLDTNIIAEKVKLTNTLGAKSKRGGTKSSILLFESHRGFEKLKPLAFQFAFNDPDEEEIDSTLLSQGYTRRREDTYHSILKKVQGNKYRIADAVEKAISLGDITKTIGDFGFPDPLKPFQDAFASLLAPKKLLEVDVQKQTFYFEHEDQRFPLEALSSGEREVVNITFDFLLRNPKDSIIFFDEPEVHLHPELVQKLVQTLIGIGERNQFIFCTHSPHIISNSLENTVICISPPDTIGSNQATVVRDDDETQLALKILGQSIGVITLGNKIVFIEGENSSLDKDVYSRLIKEKYPKMVLVPAGGKTNLINFSSVMDSLLSKSIWGVDFFILADKDASPNNVTTSSNSKFRCLNRYHLENYFLDANVISNVFEELVEDNHWLRSPEEIEKQLKKIAASVLSYAASLRVHNRLRYDGGNIDVMVKGCDKLDKNSLINSIAARSAEERVRVSGVLDDEAVKKMVKDEYESLENELLSGDQWKLSIPGKIILKQFCTLATFDYAKFKRAYIAKGQKSANNPFADVINIFEDFSRL